MNSKYVWIFRRLLTHPRWVWSWLVQVHLFSHENLAVKNRIKEYENFLFSPEEVFGQSDQIQQYLKEAKEFSVNRTLSEKGIPLKFDGDNDLALLCYVAIRVKKPSVVVETGVARGVTSSYLLKALEANGQGHLYSIDLPMLRKEAEAEVGSLVDSSLKSRWTLLLGPSLHEIKKLQKKVGKIDIFIHDSDHSYKNQKKEYLLALNWLNPKGFLISDDVWNNALLEFFEQNKKSIKTLKTTRKRKDSFLGFIEKA
jgi:predicted O-methyltransferase YrrM